MNRDYKKESLKDEKLPLRIDTYSNKGELNTVHHIEYDGWHFQGKSVKAVINRVLKYIFVGGEE